MTGYRHLAWAATIGVTALVMTAVTPGPAMAAEANGQLSRLPSRMAPGGGAAQLVGIVANPSTREIVPAVQVIFSIRLSGLQPDQVRLSGLDLSGEPGDVRATVNVGPLGRRQSRPLGYSLQFLADAPAGRATVSMEVYVREERDWRRTDTARVTTTVQSGRATPTPTPSARPSLSPGPSLDPVPTVGAAGSPGVAAPVITPAADQDGRLWPLYALGLLLVLAGVGAVVALLVLRRRERRDDPEPIEPATTLLTPGGFTPGGPASGFTPGGPVPAGGYPTMAGPAVAGPTAPGAPGVIYPAAPGVYSSAAAAPGSYPSPAGPGIYGAASGAASGAGAYPPAAATPGGHPAVPGPAAGSPVVPGQAPSGGPTVPGPASPGAPAPGVYSGGTEATQPVPSPETPTAVIPIVSDPPPDGPAGNQLPDGDWGSDGDWGPDGDRRPGRHRGGGLAP